MVGFAIGIGVGISFDIDSDYDPDSDSDSDGAWLQKLFSEQSLTRLAAHPVTHENGCSMGHGSAMDEGRFSCDAFKLAEQSDLAAAPNP